MIAKLRAWWTRGQLLGREIVAKRVGIMAALGIVLGLGVDLGVVPVDLSRTVTAWTTAGITALAALAAIKWARGGVTPADPVLQPTDADGRRLVPVGSVAAARRLDTSTPAKHDALCPSAKFHGNPFRYCPDCDWTE